MKFVFVFFSSLLMLFCGCAAITPDVTEAPRHQIEGLGLIVGLRDTGDKDGEMGRRLYRAIRYRPEFSEETELTPGSFAVVRVWYDPEDQPVKARDKARFQMETLNDAESLRNGKLLPTSIYRYPKRKDKAPLLLGKISGDVRVDYGIGRRAEIDIRLSDFSFD